jgi:pimeloyl-ACP methyl ester carboxylesterase
MQVEHAVLRRDYVDIADGQVHRVARAGHGTPVVFLHQTASSSRMWLATMAGVGVLNPLWALDTPGFGSSFDPVIEPGMGDYVGWLRNVFARCAIPKVHFVGHHTGASIALAFAIEYPDAVASLTLLGPAVLTSAEREHYAARLGAPFRPQRSGAYLLKNWEYLRVGGADADTGLLHREMIDMLRGWAARPHAYRAVWAQDTGEQLARVDCPLHLISSPDDLLFDQFTKACALRPDARSTVLSGGANFSPDLVTGELVAALEDSGFFSAGLAC